MSFSEGHLHKFKKSEYSGNVKVLEFWKRQLYFNEMIFGDFMTIRDF